MFFIFYIIANILILIPGQISHIIVDEQNFVQQAINPALRTLPTLVVHHILFRVVSQAWIFLKTAIYERAPIIDVSVS